MAYNSAYTGQQIDAAVGAVTQKESTWDSKQDALTGTEDQIVGFNSTGNAIPVPKPIGLPDGGTTGQMLYQGESGPEWGIPPYLGSMPQLDYSQMKSLHALGITDLNNVTEPGTYVGMSNMGGYPTIANLPSFDAGLAIFWMEVRKFTYPVDGSTTLIEQRVYPIAPSYSEIGGYCRYGVFNAAFSAWVKAGSADSISFTQDSSGLASDNVQDAIEEVNAKIPAKPKSVSVTLSTSAWSSNSQTVTVSGILADETKQLIQPMPAMASQSAYYGAGVLCSGQAANSLTFTCQNVPTEDLTVYVVMQEVGA